MTQNHYNQNDILLHLLENVEKIILWTMYIGIHFIEIVQNFDRF
jgi:hypothetical protein